MKCQKVKEGEMISKGDVEISTPSCLVIYFGNKSGIIFVENNIHYYQNIFTAANKSPNLYQKAKK